MLNLRRTYILLLEKEMATHSSVLAWRIPGTGEPGGLPSMGSQKSRFLSHRMSKGALGDIVVGSPGSSPELKM